MSGLPILYSFRRCPYALRARMAIAVSGVQVELREVVLRDKPAELLEASAKATVPVLVLPDGQVIDESLGIMHWALGLNDPENWLAHIDDALIAANDGPFKQSLDRYKYPNRYGLADGLKQRDAAVQHLTMLNEALSGVPFLGRERPGFADIALFPFVRQFAATDQAWFDSLPLPALQQWLAGIVQSQLFDSIMMRYQRWKAGDVKVLFPQNAVMPAEAGI